MFLIRKTGPSDGASALRQALLDAGQRCLFTEKSTFNKPHLIINWGGEADPVGSSIRVLNNQASRRVAMNKIAAFTVLEAAGVSIPKFFTTAGEAAEYRASLRASSNPIILARRTATGQGGEGITIVRMGQDLPTNCQLYTQYIRKYAEYRVHVVNGEAIAVQQKRVREGAEMDDDQRLIRNAANGWVFCTVSVDDYAEQAKALAINAARALSLDIAAIDIIRGRDNNLYVLEANTKPGLESPTVLAAYVTALIPLHP